MLKQRLVFLPLLLLLCMAFFSHQGECRYQRGVDGFARVSGTRFFHGNRPLYMNGFNAYWLMQLGSNPSDRVKVTSTFQQASRYGMNMARTWAFSDGGSNPLQISPGTYDENIFKGLDFVVSEAKKYGIYLILSLVNNYENYGGRKQYVKWGRDRGQNLNSDDDFYVNPVVKAYYKNHVMAVLTRVNTITGVAYKDEPTIFAWELMNEPRCQSDLSGFYGESMPEKKVSNLGFEVGTDFISNNQIPGVDFATIHLYPDQWLSSSIEQDQMAFVDRWIAAHIEDSNTVLKKPLLVAEFGRSSRTAGYTVTQRDSYFWRMYNTIYNSARTGGSCAGGLFWQLMTEGMDSFRDGYEVLLDESPTTAGVVVQQSHKLSTIT